MTRSDANYQVFDYIEVYYNRKRLHSKLGYISPEAFEAKKVTGLSVREIRARSETNINISCFITGPASVETAAIEPQPIHGGFLGSNIRSDKCHFCSIAP